MRGDYLVQWPRPKNSSPRAVGIEQPGAHPVSTVLERFRGRFFACKCALSQLEEALYFSMVTYTTLGYGDITLDPAWRLLASFEAANGILIFGWSTGLIVAYVQRFASQHDGGRKGT